MCNKITELHTYTHTHKWNACITMWWGLEKLCRLYQCQFLLFDIVLKEIPFGRSRLSVLRTPRTFFCTFLWIWNCFKIKDFWSLHYFKFRRSLLLLELTFQHSDQDAAPMVPGLPELPVPADLSHTPGQVMSLLWSSIPHLQKEEWMTVQSSCSSRDAGPHMD